MQKQEASCGENRAEGLAVSTIIIKYLNKSNFLKSYCCPRLTLTSENVLCFKKKKKQKKIQCIWHWMCDMLGHLPETSHFDLYGTVHT